MLKRDTSNLNQKEFDIIIIGGGIFGACAVREAAYNGLSVLLLEQKDFSHATSANHFKMIHGGIRYLQHGDILRIRESSKERSALLRIAPHLAAPLPIAIPTYGWGKKSKLFLSAGMLIYDGLTFDRNREINQDRKIPISQFLTESETRRLFPEVNPKGLTGSAVFNDGQIHHPPRLALSFIRSAIDKGALVLNYFEVLDFLKEENSKVVGVKAKDRFSGDEFAIRSRFVLNAAGPWASRLLLSKLPTLTSPIKPVFSRDLALVTKRKPKHAYGLAVSTDVKDNDIFLDRGGRHLFMVPWRQYTLIGVWHRVFHEAPEHINVSRNEIKQYIHEVNRTLPGLGLSPDEILQINTGLTLFGEEKEQTTGGFSFGKRSILIDHEKNNSLSGLVTLIGVRATTARGMAEKAIKLILKKSNQKPIFIDSEDSPVWGGNFTSFDDLVNKIKTELPKHLNKDKYATHLARNYGSEYNQIIKYINNNSRTAQPIGDTAVISAEILHAIQEEMALSLEDIVFRRTDIAIAGDFKEQDLLDCADIMAERLGWDNKRKTLEIHSIKGKLPTFCNNRDLLLT